jgi:hypothetical protein
MNRYVVTLLLSSLAAVTATTSCSSGGAREGDAVDSSARGVEAEEPVATPLTEEETALADSCFEKLTTDCGSLAAMSCAMCKSPTTVVGLAACLACAGVVLGTGSKCYHNLSECAEQLGLGHQFCPADWTPHPNGKGCCAPGRHPSLDKCCPHNYEYNGTVCVDPCTVPGTENTCFEIETNEGKRTCNNCVAGTSCDLITYECVTPGGDSGGPGDTCADTNNPCCGDPCCGDPCCGDPCCGDPCCGQPCGEETEVCICGIDCAPGHCSCNG